MQGPWKDTKNGIYLDKELRVKEGRSISFEVKEGIVSQYYGLLFRQKPHFVT